MSASDEGTPRQRARAQMLAEIRRIGRRHLATEGAAALSLRAVARDLGVVSSAVYRYVASRDELLTLLVVDGYDELGDAVDAALAEVPAHAHRDRFVAVGRAVRGWARREPATYALLFGSPVPGYEAPAEQTTGPGTRVALRMVEILADARAADAVRPTLPPPGPTSATLRADLERMRSEMAIQLSDDDLVRGLTAWAAMFGCVGFEVFGQYGADTFTAADDLGDRQLHLLADLVGLP